MVKDNVFKQICDIQFEYDYLTLILFVWVITQENPVYFLQYDIENSL